MHRDFNDFANSDSNVILPLALEHQLLKTIKNDLKPSHTRTLLMLVLVQAIAGAFTLLICPQFGFGFTDGLMHVALLHVSHHLGSQICTILCSIVFVTPGVVLATLTLPRQITTNIRIWHFVGTAVLLLLPLAVVASASLAAMLAWLLGSMTISVPYVYVKDWYARQV